MSERAQMKELVFTYPPLRERLEKRATEKGSAEAASDRAKVLENLEEIAANFSKTYINPFVKFLDTTLAKLYDGINLGTNNLDIDKLCAENCVVLTPNHQSHADYLAINYVFYKHFKRILYVAGGVNLNIFPIGTLFRKSGCFFIRRSFNNDILYKLTLEAYLYYLLYKREPIEFFFEGGRSRTGKLLSPRFGLYHMLVEAHSHLPESVKAPLLFLPVSIVHEYVPETKALARELKGGAKKAESAGQVFGLVRLFSSQFGNVHINFGNPISTCDVVRESDDQRQLTHELAFACFREVGKNMMVTPSSLLALIMLDEPTGAMKWESIVEKARHIMSYCRRFGVPFVDSLQSDEKMEKILGRTLDIFIANKKMEAIGDLTRSSTIFYSIKEDSRSEVLYFKNTILHHFLVPWMINAAWVGVFNGSIKDGKDLRDFLLREREKLKHEFYLPTVRELFEKGVSIISDSIGREAKSMDEFMHLSHQELYAIARRVGVFSRICNYIFEGYFVSAVSLRALGAEGEGFKFDQYMKKFKEVYESERRLGRVIRYPESYSEPVAKSALNYFSHRALIENDMGTYKATEPDRFDSLIEEIERGIRQKLTFNIDV